MRKESKTQKCHFFKEKIRVNELASLLPKPILIVDLPNVQT